MALLKLYVFGVRNIKQVNIIPSTGINFIYGYNASGKSALLEAIFLLARVKSFRGSANKTIINNQAGSLIISGLCGYDGCAVHLGVQIHLNGNSIISVNHQTNNQRANLAYAFPLQIYHPKSYELLDAGSQLRREFLDWGLFHNQNNFLLVWRQYKKILGHRNFLLKHRDTSQLYFWTQQLIVAGNQVAELRRQYVEQLTPFFHSICKQFFHFESVSIKYFAGWPSEKSILECIELDHNKDLQMGFTHSGPHRGDFLVYVNGQLAKHYVSRGQLKLLVLALLLAQIELFIRQGHPPPCILIDDFAAELDMIHRQRVLHYLNELGCQAFISAIDKADFGDIQYINEFKMFHVEHGSIQ